MIDNEIIKALECCINSGKDFSNCEDCPYHAKGTCLTNTEIFDLINRQKAEIETLQAVNAEMHESLRLASEVNKDMRAEYKAKIERLTTLAELGNMRANDYRVMRDRALKAESQRDKAVKDFTKFAHTAPDNPFACIYCAHSVHEGRACEWKREHEDESCLGKYFKYRM